MDVYLSASSSILRCPASDEFGFIVLEQVVIEAHMLFLGQDGVVGFEAVFLEEGFIAVGQKKRGQRGVLL